MANLIERRPDVMMGKAVFSGTRIPVELVLRKLGEGATEPEVLEAYPSLSSPHLRAAFVYAAEVISGEELVLFDGEATRTR